MEKIRSGESQIKKILDEMIDQDFLQEEKIVLSLEKNQYEITLYRNFYERASQTTSAGLKIKRNDGALIQFIAEEMNYHHNDQRYTYQVIETDNKKNIYGNKYSEGKTRPNSFGKAYFKKNIAGKEAIIYQPEEERQEVFYNSFWYKKYRQFLLEEATMYPKVYQYNLATDTYHIISKTPSLTFDIMRHELNRVEHYIEEIKQLTNELNLNVFMEESANIAYALEFQKAELLDAEKRMSFAKEHLFLDLPVWSQFTDGELEKLSKVTNQVIKVKQESKRRTDIAMQLDQLDEKDKTYILTYLKKNR